VESCAGIFVQIMKRFQIMTHPFYVHKWIACNMYETNLTSCHKDMWEAMEK